MSLKKELKHLIKIMKFENKNIFKRKTPIYIPTYESNLLKGRVALITGSTSGIGYSIADLFCKNGSTVVISGRNKDKLDIAFDKITKENPKAKIYKSILDISKPELFEKELNNITRQLGNSKIDILVNNAGVSSKSSIEKPNIDDYDSTMNCNLRGVYFLSSLLAKYMKNHKVKGNILNISSSSSNRPATTPYAISKWGIKGLTIGMAKKYIDDEIIVNAIAPGPTATKMMIDENDNDISRNQYPMNRLITPEEVANLAVFLVSNMGKTIVGQTIFMSSGLGIITVDDIDY